MAAGITERLGLNGERQTHANAAMNTAKIEKALRDELKQAQRAQEHERRHGTPESYQAATDRVADILDVLRGK